MKCLNTLLLSSLLLLGLAACTPKDPSVNDLKSPCVSSGMGEDDPCERRSPILNPIIENKKA
jgi:hypothetical protein